jgi:prefoldin subunit 5
MADVSGHLDELRFEVGELRGRIESLQATLDALVRSTQPLE